MQIKPKAPEERLDQDKPINTTRYNNIYVLLPAFNEEASLPNLLKRFERKEDFQNKLIIYVIDDGSSDSTASIAIQAQKHINLKIYSHENNMGLGQAINTGLFQILKVAKDTDIIVIMDADDSHDTALIKDLVNEIVDGADICIASRFVEGGDDKSAPIFRRFLSRGASIVFKNLFPLENINDFTSGFRAYRVGNLRNLSIHHGECLVEEPGFACMVELLLKLRHCDPIIKEIPFVLRYERKLSQSKIKIWKTIRQYLKLALRDRLSNEPYKVVIYER